MLARRRAGDPRPAPRAERERERDACERAAPVDAADDVEPAAGDRRRGRGAPVRERGERAPGAALEHEDGPERQPVAAVAADDVDAAVGGGGCGVVDRDRQVGQPPPAVVRHRVGVDARRVAAAGDEPADDDDLSSGGRRGDLGARLGQRACAAPSRSARPAGGEAEQGRREQRRPEETAGERSSQNRWKGHLSAPKSRC